MAEDEGLIDGYKLVTCIASGGTSQVWEVAEPNTHRHLAMKLLNGDHPDFKEHKAGLKYEASVCKALDHPNIIKYEGFSSGRDHTYMLMEYFRAPTIKVQLKLDMNAVHLRLRKLVEGVCGALQHVHERGYVHRDIKPENVLMNKAGEVRLIDFSLSSKCKAGLAAMFAGKQQTIQGTRTYIAPETIRKQQPTFQTDFYSLGIMLFEVLTGRTPFQAPTPNELLQKHLSAEAPLVSEFNANVTPEMARLVAKLLSKKPAQRGKDVPEIAAELRRIKFFKEEIREKVESAGTESKPVDLLQQLAESKLDSRLDARRSEMIRDNPQLAQQVADQSRKRQEEQAARKAKQAAKSGAGAAPEAPTPTPPAPMPVPPQPVAYPNQPMMMPMPQMMPGYPAAGGYPTGIPLQPIPGYPQMPGQPLMNPMPFVGQGGQPAFPTGGMTPPQAAMPPRPAAPQGTPAAAPGTPAVPVASAPKPPQAVAPPKAVGSPPPVRPAQPATAPGTATPAVPAKPVPQKASETEADLEFMTELPDIL